MLLARLHPDFTWRCFAYTNVLCTWPTLISSSEPQPSQIPLDGGWGHAKSSNSLQLVGPGLGINCVIIHNTTSFPLLNDRYLMNLNDDIIIDTHIYIYNTPYIAQDLCHLEAYGALLLQEANQQILRNNLWMIDAYNSTTKVAWSKSFRMRSYGEPRPTNSFSIKMCYKLDNVFDVFSSVVLFYHCCIMLYHVVSLLCYQTLYNYVCTSTVQW